MRQLSGGGRLTRAVAAISVLSVVSLAFMGIANVNTRSLAQDASRMRVTSRSDAARAKVHPNLLRAMADTPNAAVAVHAYVKAGTDLSQYMPDGIARHYVDPAGNVFVTGTIKAANVLKAAGLSSVVAIVPMTGDYAPTLDPDAAGNTRVTPSADLAAKLSARVQSGVRSNNGRGNDVAPTGWYDVLDTHQSSLAWEKGYTGAGVKVMVNDTGTDYANPDLIDTWALVDDPSSPYYGWPLQFDQLSMYLFARDTILGETNIASGGGDYVDTSTVITAGDSSFQPLDAAEPYSYTLTGTSMSGDYHIGTHPDNTLRTWYRIANGLDLGDPEIADERPAILVVDEHQAGVYDTVYVDLDFDHDFSNEKAVNRDDPISGADWWGAWNDALGDFDPNPDGFYDESGGLVYWIADGVNPPPAADWNWGIGVVGNGAADEGEPGAGNMVAFAINDFAESPGGNHGTLCASNVVAQGLIDADSYGYVLNGDPVTGRRPDYKPEGTMGMIVGAGIDVQLVTTGDFYSYGGYDAFLFAALGYDGIPGTGDDVQIMSNSWGHTREVADGWDFDSRIIDYYNRLVNPTLLVTFSAGNDGPGFGSLSGPEPASALTVGASTQYGSVAWDSASSVDQINYGDAAWFTSRGPSATGTAGVDVMADGQRASGLVPINEALSGAHAWEIWGGTSRSSPVTAGNAALMYQAYLETHGSWPDYETAKSIMMSSSRDLNFDPFTQGAGMINGNRAVDLASGADGGYVWPGSWSAGDYEGFNFPGFANIMTPGEVSQGTFSITNTSDHDLTYAVSDRWLQHADSWETSWTSNPIDEEPIAIVEDDPAATEFDWNTPHYLWDITDLIPADTDVMVARYNFPYDLIDPSGSYDFNQAQDWQLLVYDWTDVNGDGNLWSDNNGNGQVDEGEIDAGEYMRYDYSRPFANSAGLTVQRPRDRHHDGIFMGLQHRQARLDVPQTTFLLGLDFYQNSDFGWLTTSSDSITVAAGHSVQFSADVEVPGDTPPGEYEGHIVLDDGAWTTTIPVTVNVAARNYNVEGGDDPAAGYYNNSVLHGAQDWSGNYVQGDYRHFFVDLSENPAGLGNRLESGTQYFIVDSWWGNLPTDVNIHILGPTADPFSNDPEVAQPEYYGPYTLAELGKSNDGYVTGGAFFPDTSSGANREVVAAPYVPGLNEIVLHNVTYSGDAYSEGFQVRAGALAVSQSPIDASRSASDPDFFVEETLISTMPLSGLVVQGFGLSSPEVETSVPILQDDPNDPFTASYTKQVHLEHAGLLDIAVDGQDEDDLDLYLLYDFNGDGEFDGSELIGASATGAPDEQVTVSLPADGDYLILVHGWAVPAGESTFDIAVNAVQGDDISASSLPEGEVQAGQRYTFSIDIDGDGHEPGVYSGLVTLGPPEGPAAVLIPVTYEIRGE